MNEDILLENASLREFFCKEENAYILERVGQLMTLPETGFGTAQQAAAFYKTSEATIKSVILRHKAEFKRCGYKVLSKKDFCEMHYASHKSLYVPKTRNIGILPRPCILLCGCLLRDSKIAKAIRSYLKNKAKDKGNMRMLWVKFNRHFEITRYSLLPENRFKEALQWLEDYCYENRHFARR